MKFDSWPLYSKSIENQKFSELIKWQKCAQIHNVRQNFLWYSVSSITFGELFPRSHFFLAHWFFCIRSAHKAHLVHQKNAGSASTFEGQFFKIFKKYFFFKFYCTSSDTPTRKVYVAQRLIIILYDKSVPIIMISLPCMSNADGMKLVTKW